MFPSVETLQSAVLEFETNAISARRKLVDFYQDDPDSFLNGCLPSLCRNAESAGAQFVVALLLDSNRLERTICDPSLVQPEQAAGIVRVAKRTDPGFEGRLLREASRTGSADLARLLEILVLSSRSEGLRQLLNEITNHPDPFIKSKAALWMGQLNQNTAWVQQRLSDPDHRVRANALESIWGEANEEAKALFRKAAASPSNRVAGNAWVGLYLAGEPQAIQGILKMASHPSPLFQATAIWAMGYVADPRFLGFLVKAMASWDESMRVRIFEAIRRIRYRRDQVGYFGALRVHLRSAVRMEDGKRRVQFAVFDSGRRGVLDAGRLLPTHVIASEDQSAVLDYEVHPLAQPEELAIAFIGLDRQTQERINTLRRPTDTWASSDSLDDACGSGARHILLAGAVAVPGLSAKIENASRGGITIHTVLPESAPASTLLQVEALSRETGGFALRFADTDALARHIESILASLLAPFELTYTSPKSEEGSFAEVRVQVFGPRGTGEASAYLRQHS